MARPAVLAIRIVGESRSARKSITATQRDLGRLQKSVKATAKVFAAASLGKAATAMVAPIVAATSAGALALGALGLAAAKQVSNLQQVADAAKKYSDAQEEAATKKRVADKLAAQGSPLAEKAAKQYQAALLKVRTTQQAWLDSSKGIPRATAAAALSLAKLKTAYGSWSDKLSPTTMPLLAQGFDIARQALSGLTPLVKTAASALGPFLDRVQAAVKSGAFARWAADMAKVGGPVLKSLLNAIGNIGGAFAALGSKLGPSSRQFGKVLDDLTKKFKAWASGSGGDRFAKLAKQAVPALGQMLQAVVRLSAAFSPFAGVTLTIATALAALINAMPMGALQAMVPVIMATVVVWRMLSTVMIAVRLYMLATAAAIAINTAAQNGNRAAVIAQTAASRAAVLVQRAWAVVTRVSTIAMLAQRTAMLAARTATLAWAAAQRILNLAMLASPIGIVIVAIVALVAVVVVAYKKSDTFRSIVQSLWGVMKSVAAYIAGVFVAAWKKLWSVIQLCIRVVQSVISWLRRIVAPAALTVIRTYFNLITTAVRAVIKVVQSVISWLRRIAVPAALNSIKSAFRAAADAAEWLIQKVQDVISWIKKIPGGGLLSKAISAVTRSAPAPGPQARSGVGAARSAYASTPQGAPQLAMTTQVFVSIDGQQLQGRINRTVNTALVRDGSRLWAGGWA